MAAELAPAEARRVAIAAQGLDRARRPVGRVTMRHLQKVIDQIGQLQIDSVNVAVRAHYMPLFARLGPYDPALLDRAAGSAPRRLFEYWGHAASLIDVELEPAVRFRMDAQAARAETKGPHHERDRADLVARVRADLRSQGPLTARDIEHDEVRDRSNWGWNWSAVKDVLEWLFDIGEVSVATRNRQFERRYDLTERVIPPAVRDRPTPAVEESHLILVRRAARALGIASTRCLSDYFRTAVAPTQVAVDELVRTGELLPQPVAGWPAPTYLWHEARLPRRSSTQALVSPFDSLVFERERLESLFGVNYRIEIYTPVSKRRYGYYVYLFVMDDLIAARVDLKADRTLGALLVQASWIEAHAEPRRAEVAVRLASELLGMAGWLGLSGVVVSPVGDLHPDLTAACASPVSPEAG